MRDTNVDVPCCRPTVKFLEELPVIDSKLYKAALGTALNNIIMGTPAREITNINDAVFRVLVYSMYSYVHMDGDYSIEIIKNIICACDTHVTALITRPLYNFHAGQLLTDPAVEMYVKLLVHLYANGPVNSNTHIHKVLSTAVQDARATSAIVEALLEQCNHPSESVRTLVLDLLSVSIN